MKRLLAILLILVTLISLAVMIPGSATEYNEAPFYMVNIMGPRYVAFPENIGEMPKATLTPIKKGDAKITITLLGASDIPTMAAKLKEEFANRPEGMRYLNFPLLIDQQVEHMIYMDKTVALFKAWIKEFFTEYKRIGGEIDGLVVDAEYSAFGAYYINTIYKKSVTIKDEVRGTSVTLPQNKSIYTAIVSDSRYAAEVRPYLEERGFKFSTPNADQSEIYSISVSDSLEYDIWNAVMNNRYCKYINDACAPFVALYPYAGVSSYCSSGSNQWDENTIQTGSIIAGGNTMYAGNTANENFFLNSPNTQMQNTGNGYTTPMAYNQAVYEDTSFNAFLYEVNSFKDMYSASGNKRISAWIKGFNYLENKVRPNDGIAYSPYYAETLFHIGMLNPQPFLGYVVGPQETDQNEDPFDYNYVMRNISEILKELTRVAGYADRKPISVPKNWNSNFVISGMYAGGRNIWRITPNTSKGIDVEAFKVKNQVPTFAIDGETIIFPQGRIIENNKIYETGTCGYWVETPVNVTPVVVTDANRYEKIPAYEENFETYAAGTAFSNTTARHTDAWTVSGTATVQSHNGSKALEMTGTAALENTKIPMNVTAGDSYAKQQTWEVTVTVPNSGELKLLSCGENDSGIRIAGGKVYYDGETVLANVTAGKTYIISREVDFRNANAFTSTYTVLNADGTKVAQKAGVAMAAVEIPVKSISFASTDVDKAYIDNYRLRATGVTAELKLYEADTGMRIADTTAARSEDTVYRLSWYNASGSYQVAKIYNNGTLVQTVAMPSGADSYVTGLVEGESQLTVTVEKGTAPTHPNYDGEAFDWLPDPVVPPETTAPSETVEDTTSGTEGTTTPSASENTTSPTTPAAPSAPTTGKKGLSGGAIALIVIGALLVLAGGGFALCWFVIKPKWLMELEWNKATFVAILQAMKSKILAVVEWIKSKKKG